MKNLNANVILVCASALLCVGLWQIPTAIEKWKQPVVVVTPDQTPNLPVVKKWQAELTAELKAENNPERVEQLRNLWAAFSLHVPSEATSIVHVESLNQLAGRIATLGLGPRNADAGKIITQQFEYLIADLSDPLDQSEREKIRLFFLELEKAATAAL